MTQWMAIPMHLNMKVDGWIDVGHNNQPQNQTVYIGRINMKTWMFEHLVSAAVPFQSDEYVTAYSPMRGYYVLTWPEPDYDLYVSIRMEYCK